MISIDKKEKCCGCSACYSVCPKKCISMVPDSEGFLYPKVNMEACVDCRLCEKVCPVSSPPDIDKSERKSYILRVKESKVLSSSASGGFITPLAEWVWQQGGVLCAASYNNNFYVEHQLFSDSKEINKIRGSKYVQSNLNDCFRELGKILNINKIVCFVGTPCQVNGLISFLGKKYDNLITVDLVCHGTPSPKLWERYLKYQEERYHSPIEEVSFKNKTYGYHGSTMKIRFKNGKVYYGSPRVDYMLKSFYKDISSRPICYECPFKTLERCSDFTIYDCWKPALIVEGLKDDDLGYTNVIVQSAKGQEILNEIKDSYTIYSADTKKVVSQDGIMICNSSKPHPKRKEFYVDLEDESLLACVQKCIPVSKTDYVLERSKKILYKTGLIKFTRALSRMISK